LNSGEKELVQHATPSKTPMISPRLSRGLKRAHDSNVLLRRSLRRRGNFTATAALANTLDALNFGPGDDPTCFQDAMIYPEWRKAMSEEFASLTENVTWDYVDCETLNGRKAIGCKWVYKTKVNADRTLRYKARLVIKGYEQTDFGETYAPVARLTSLRMLIALSAQFNWQVHHMDVVTAFLNPTVDEEVFMALPEGFEWLQPGFAQNSVCRLRKALYGLKQAPRLWFKDIDAYLKSIDFTPSEADQNVYISHSKRTILLLYVDDMLIASGDVTQISDVKQLLRDRYKMSDLGTARQFLGIDIDQQPGSIRLSQDFFIRSVIRRFGMDNCNGVWTPLESRPPLEFNALGTEDQRLYQSLIGSVMYIMLGTRPDLAYTISALSKYSASAGEDHLSLAKRVLRYLQQTKDLGLIYGKDGSLHGFSDSDWAGDLGDRKSTGGFIFLLSGAAISWKSKKQTIVALSTTEAEYIAASEAARESIWLQRLSDDLAIISSVPHSSPMVVFTDSTGCLSQMENARHHERTKHIDIKFHYVRDVYERQLIDFQHCSTHDMTADILTKPLSRQLHWHHLKHAGLQPS
jgi:hypothetical protein